MSQWAGQAESNLAYVLTSSRPCVIVTLGERQCALVLENDDIIFITTTTTLPTTSATIARQLNSPRPASLGRRWMIQDCKPKIEKAH